MSDHSPTDHDRLVRHQRVLEIFQRACDLQSPQRDAVLDVECAGDADLRSRVEALLRADSAPDHLFDKPATLAGALWPSNQPLEALAALPDHIGRYRLIGLIGSGGMGDVYEAQQESPKRSVALKVMHRWTNDVSGLATRFEQEGEIQASLAHPGIAQVYESGAVLHAGRRVHFIAMELVAGVPLSTFMQTQSLSPEGCIRFFLQLCAAVGFAHQRGVIHRDLKPANIFVCESETGPAPKVLDFGVAKLTGGSAPLVAMQTQAGQIIGTLAYMSPEQALGQTEDLDIRADIYSLGLILFELLTGRLPIDLRNASITEAARRIAEEAPARLSAVLPSLRGDLETILSKATAKDRAARYDSIPEFAADLRRYLNHEPIAARPPTFGYQFVKFARRNRGLVAAASAALIMLAGGLALSTALYFRSEAARRVSDEKDRLSTAVRDYMISELLLSASPTRMGYDVKMLDVVTKASGGLAGRFPDNPDIEGVIRADLATVLTTLGKLEESRAEYKVALPLLERAFGRDDERSIKALSSYSTTLMQLRQDHEGLEAAQETLARARRALPGDHVQLVFALNQVGSGLETLGRSDEAVAALSEGLAIAERDEAKHSEVMSYLLTGLAQAEQSRGNIDASVAYRYRTLDVARRFQTDNGFTLFFAQANMVGMLIKFERFEEAATLATGLQKDIDRLFAPGDPRRDTIGKVIGGALVRAGRFEEAEPILLSAHAGCEAAFKNFDWVTEQAVHGLRSLYRRWPGHGQQLRVWSLEAIKARMMLAHASERANLLKVLAETEDQCRAAGASLTGVEALEALWKGRDSYAPPGHGRRAAFFANFARLCDIVERTEHREEALVLAKEAIEYATERPVAELLIADASNPRP